MRLIKRTKRTSAFESEATDDSLLRGYLNYPAGKAVRALFELLRREMAECEVAAGSRADVPHWFRHTFLEPIGREPMTLGVDAWIGLGRFYALLSSRAPDATAFVASHLKSDSSGLSTTAVAFWAGHLSAPQVSSDVLERLVEEYRTGAPILQREGMLEGDLRDRFCQHLVIGAVRDVPGYDDLLLATLGAEFTSETRGAVVFALGCALQEAADEPGTPFHARATDSFLQYWSAHVDKLGGEDGAQLAKYLRWLSHLNVAPGEIVEPIKVSLSQVDDSFDVGEVFEYLWRHSGEDTQVILKLMDRCVEWYRLHRDCWLDSQKVRAFLDRIVPLAPDKPTLREVVAGFTELGVISTDDLRRYLPRD